MYFKLKKDFVVNPVVVIVTWDLNSPFSVCVCVSEMNSGH